MDQASKPEDFGFGRLFADIKDAVVVADASTERILLWNGGATEMFGYTLDEALSMPLHQLVAPRLVEFHRDGVALYAASGTGELVDSGMPVEVEAVRKDGSTLFVELTLTSLSQDGPEGARVVMALIRDATHRKASEMLREAQRSQQHALELNDSVVQDIVLSKAYFELDDPEAGLAALEKALHTARSMVGELMEEQEVLFGLQPGDFVRSRPVSPEPETNP
jgi:PAS domain S-box-containing protein